MSGFSENHIDSFEKKIPVYQLHRMYQERRVVFPNIPSSGRARKMAKISETLETVFLGLSLPVVYASERQDGSLLVLDTSDHLRYLMEFLDGRYPAGELEFYPKLSGYRLEEMEEQFPRITSLLYDYRASFQIIEYTTPKYMHMQVGKYIEKWNFTREQGIRNQLYGEELDCLLDSLVCDLGRSADFLSRWKLNRQYMMLRILMYRFVFQREIWDIGEENIGLQLLLDRTIACLERKGGQWKMELRADIREITEELAYWGRQTGFPLSEKRGKEWQARVLGYLYNVVWMCREMRIPVQRGLGEVTSDERLWRDIDNEKVNFINIQRHHYEIERRLK